MESTDTSDAKARGPKKAFLSRARSSSSSITDFSGSSGTSLKELTGLGRSSFSGLDILANSSEIVASKRVQNDSLPYTGSADELKSCFSKRTRDDSLSHISLPDEMKISFSELEDPALNLEDLNFNCPQSIEDAAPSNVTLDLTPRHDLPSSNEPNLELLSTVVSSTSNEQEFEVSASQVNNGSQCNPYMNSHQNISCDSNDIKTNAPYISVNQSAAETRTNVTSNITSSQFSGKTSGSKPGEKDYMENQSAGSELGSLLRESTSAIITDQTGYERWETVTELPWADDRLVEEITQVSTTVGSSTEEVLPKKKRRVSGMSKSKKMDNILCQVCGDLAAGFYCGAYICEACKKFYMRAYKQEKLKYVCLRDKQCVITKESRVQCQYCRYQKCLSLNMFCPKQGNEGASSKEAHMSDIPCRVCAAPSSGFHFGAITCEGCKGFFRRMAKEREPERYQCTKDGKCEINMVTRNLCKACRYRECLKVGMSIEGSRIGRQPNSVKHEISLELKQGAKKDFLPKNSDPIVIKEEPQDFSEGCSMSESRESSSMTDLYSSDTESVLKHSVTISGLVGKSHSSQALPKKKSRDIMRDLLLSENPSSNIQQRKDGVRECSLDQTTNVGPLQEGMPQTSGGTAILGKHSPEKAQEHDSKINIAQEPEPQKSVQGRVTVQKVLPKKRSLEAVTPQSCSFEESLASRSSHIVPQKDLCGSDTDTSYHSDDGQEVKGNELMNVINGIIEAARCLELVNYRVFDTDFISDGKYIVEDVKKKFKDRFMDPKFKNKIATNMSAFSAPNTTWACMMNAFNDHAYIIIRFAKNVPGFRSLELQDQSILLQSSIYPIVLLNLSKVYDPVTKMYNFFNFTQEETNRILLVFPMLRVLVQHFQHVGEIVSNLKFTNEEFALLSAILLCPAEVRGLKQPDKVEELQNKISSALQYYEENTYPDGMVRYGSLIVRIAELVQCRLQHKLSIGLLLSANPKLKVPQLFDELVVECINDK